MIIREDITQDQLIDVLVGNRIYMKCLYVSSDFGIMVSISKTYQVHGPKRPHFNDQGA